MVSDRSVCIIANGAMQTSDRTLVMMRSLIDVVRLTVMVLCSSNSNIVFVIWSDVPHRFGLRLQDLVVDAVVILLLVSDRSICIITNGAIQTSDRTFAVIDVSTLTLFHEHNAPHRSVSDSHDFDSVDFDTISLSVSSRSQRSQRRRYDHESTRRFSDPTISDRFRS